MEFTLKHPLDRSPVTVIVDDTNLVQGLFDALYSPESVRVMPFLIGQVAHGDPDAILPLAQRNIEFQNWYTEGLVQSINCAEEAPFNDDERVLAARVPGQLTEHFQPGLGFRDDCRHWDVVQTAPVENEAVHSDIPTLLVVGGYDPITPLSWSQAAAEGLTNHHLHVVLLVRAFRRREGTTFHRAALTVSAIASLTFAAWLFNRGLMLI